MIDIPEGGYKMDEKVFFGNVLQRYMALPYSSSHGEWLDASVVDTTNSSSYRTVCECYSLEDANTICKALNFSEKCAGDTNV